MSGSLEDVFIIGIIQSRYDSRNFLGVDERRCLAQVPLLEEQDIF
jgi:hypothetical protein